MKSKTIAALFAATLLSTGFAAGSFAQDGQSVPQGIEVVTIVAKRPAPTMALACVNQVIVQARAEATTGITSEHKRELQNLSQLQRSISHCIAQGTAPSEARI